MCIIVIIGIPLHAFQGMSFPREKHQSIRVVAMSAACSVSVARGRGELDASPTAAGDGRRSTTFRN